MVEDVERVHAEEQMKLLIDGKATLDRSVECPEPGAAHVVPTERSLSCRCSRAWAASSAGGCTGKRRAVQFPALGDSRDIVQIYRYAWNQIRSVLREVPVENGVAL